MKQSTNFLINRLTLAGFSFEEATSLRRIQTTLHRWAELECGGGNNFCNWAIERDEETGKPFMCHYPNSGKSWRYPIPDREKGALRRLEKILSSYPEWTYYHQTDPRGCALYLIKKSDIPKGAKLDSCYTRGIAVCD